MRIEQLDAILEERAARIAAYQQTQRTPDRTYLRDEFGPLPQPTIDRDELDDEIYAAMMADSLGG